MGKKAPKAPTPPDPVAVAQAQGAANLEAATRSQILNMVDQHTPWGSMTYHAERPDGGYILRQTLDPWSQHILQQERNLDIGMNDMAMRALQRSDATLSTPMNDWGIQQAGRMDPNLAVPYYGAPSVRGSPEVQRLGVESVQPQNTQHIANLMMQRANPQFQAQREGIRTNLINAGVREGTEAWNRAMDDYNRQYNDAAIASQLAAGQEQTRQLGADLAASQHRVGQNQFNANQQFTQGLQKSGFDFDQEMAKNQFQNALRAQQLGEFAMLADRDTAERQRQIAERAYFRQLPLNEITALMSGQQLQVPSFHSTPQTSVAPADYMGAAYQSYAGGQNAYNQQLQQQMANRAGLFGLLGTGLMTGGMMYSDYRLKDGIVQIGTLPNGLGLYSFAYVWLPMQRHIGFIAQEVERLFPRAVNRVAGFLAIDVGQVS